MGLSFLASSRELLSSLSCVSIAFMTGRVGAGAGSCSAGVLTLSAALWAVLGVSAGVATAVGAGVVPRPWVRLGVGVKGIFDARGVSLLDDSCSIQCSAERKVPSPPC